MFMFWLQLLFPPSAEQARLVRKEINNTYASKRAEYVEQLKEWMQTQPHLPRNYGAYKNGEKSAFWKC